MMNAAIAAIIPTKIQSEKNNEMSKALVAAIMELRDTYLLIFRDSANINNAARNSQGA